MPTTYELYTNENGTPKAVEGKAPAIIERVETLETDVKTLEGGVVKTINGETPDQAGNIDIPVGHNVGEEWVSYTGKIPNGGVPYCGQTVTRATYADLWAYAQAQALVKTESEWQSWASSHGGNVPYYSSGNGSTTFRMPRIVGYVKGASSQAEAGSHTKEGLPNITGGLSNNADRNVFNADQSGAFYRASSGGRRWAQVEETANDMGEIFFDASRSNAIYGNSSHVTPETSVVLFGVFAFGEVTNTGSVDVQSVANAIARVEAGYLPLTGGEVNGVIVNVIGDFIRQKITSGWTSIKGGTSDATGGYVTVYGKDSNNGMAIIGACNGEAVTELAVYYNGAAALNGHRILTINNPSVPNYSAGVDISTGYTAPTAGYVVIDSMGSYSGYTELYVNSVRVSVFKTTAQMDASCTAFVGKGDVIHFKNGGGAPRSRFYPIKVGG